jgi:hypothetical protein
MTSALPAAADGCQLVTALHGVGEVTQAVELGQAPVHWPSGNAPNPMQAGQAITGNNAAWGFSDAAPSYLPGSTPLSTQSLSENMFYIGHIVHKQSERI